jgi:hypothetical protein
MATFAIPCTPNGASEWTQRTQFDGAEYMLTFRWNQRNGHWTLSIADADETPLYDGLTLVTGVELIGQRTDVRTFPGYLLVADATQSTLTGGDLDPGFDDLGSRFQLLYIEPL